MWANKLGWLLSVMGLTAPALSLVGDQEAAPAQAEKGAAVRFTEILIQDKYGYAYGVAAADLDGDGHLDLTSVDTTKNIFYWFAGDGKGNFTRHFIGKDEPGLIERHAIGDIDRDGHPDVVCVKCGGAEVLWYQNSGKPRNGPSWKRHVITTKFTRSYDVTLADFDGDGNLDVAASCYSGNQFAWFRNPGKTDGKEWDRFLLEDKLNDTRTVRAADINGDGKIDVLGSALVTGLVVWYENPGKADQPWPKHVIDDKSLHPVHGHPVDLDGDGDLDVLMALGMAAPAGAKHSHQIVWYENVGKPGRGTRWKKHVIGDFDGAFEAIAGDIDGDGKLDVAATAWGSRGKLAWFRNPGDPRQGPWEMRVLKDFWPLANQVIVADMNKDGRLDIIASAERGANEVRWWRNEGKGNAGRRK